MLITGNQRVIYFFLIIACPVGTYGYDCEGVCLCQNDGACDPKDGRCKCKPGFKGKHCEMGTLLFLSLLYCMECYWTLLYKLILYLISSLLFSNVYQAN